MGLNVDSVVARAATKTDEKINIIFAMGHCTKMACNGLKDSRNNGGRTWLTFYQDCCYTWRDQVGIRDRQDEYRIGEITRRLDWIPYLLTCRYGPYGYAGGHSGPYCPVR